jgi:C-terminal processing protease CtpA/Prc
MPEFHEDSLDVDLALTKLRQAMDEIGTVARVVLDLRGNAGRLHLRGVDIYDSDDTYLPHGAIWRTWTLRI